MTIRLVIIAAVLLGSWAFYWILQRGEGRVRTMTDAPGSISAAVLGAPWGARATFVQFSTPICAKCPPTARLLKKVAAGQRDVAHVEVDASEQLGLAREWDIMRTPTVLVLNNLGVVVARISGAPSEAQALEALAAAPPQAAEYSI